MKNTILFLTSLFIAQYAISETAKPNARAYRAHLMTFIWPEERSSEEIAYDLLPDLSSVNRVKPKPQVEHNTGFSFGIGIGAPRTSNPFDEYKQKIDKKITVLSNHSWPMIFELRGSVIEKSFYSDKLLDGYPVLLGDVKVTLGRYLETEINYQHYEFDQFSVPALFTMVEKSNASASQSHPTIIPILSNAAASFKDENGNAIAAQPTIQLHQPKSLLNIRVERKTASKKLNYLDHPIIGTLLYFEPIKVEEAEQEIMLNEIKYDIENGIERETEIENQIENDFDFDTLPLS